MILKMAKNKLIAIIISSVVGVGAVGGGIAAIVVNVNKKDPPAPPAAIFSVVVSGEAEANGQKLGDGFSFSVKEDVESSEPAEWKVPAVELSEQTPSITYRFTLKNDGGKDATLHLKRPTTIPEAFGLTAKSGDTDLTATDGADIVTVKAGETVTIAYLLAIVTANKDVPAFDLVFELKVDAVVAQE